MNTKRKKVVVSIEQKLEALKRLDKGESVTKIADDLGVGRVTVGDWKKKRNELEKWSSERSFIAISERKTMKKCEYEKVGKALYNWYTQQKGPVTGPVLQEKALSFQKIFKEGESEFMASMGWLDRWKKRYGIKQVISNDKMLPKTTENSTSTTTSAVVEPQIEFIKVEPISTEDFEEPKKIQHSEGIKALDAALAYVAQQDEATPSDVMFFRCWRDLAARKRNTTLQ